ncbi:MAG: FAD-dependent oxidoreductase [Clostridia bacterium]|nr:FAD-dependent oxidoreductase [Clostridia bacterium]
MRTLRYSVDFCVVGGGMAGVSAAIAAARHGATVVLIQDRPVLGGNASSEVRMMIAGAHGKDNREAGILEEIECENYYINTGLKYSVWDSVIYGKVMAEKNITLLLNTSCLDAEMDGKRIKSVKAWQSNAETFHIVEAKYFADCSGDSILAPLTGAAYRYGREARDEFGESIAPEKEDKYTMGMSCILQARETDSKKIFIKPEWAYTYETDTDFPYREHDELPKNNYWWIELGGTGDCLHGVNDYQEELVKIAYGVWDHIKNQQDHGADNWELEWIGLLPGKRESRRYVGRYIINENDVRAEGKFPDVVAYGGWTMDDHFPEGFYYGKGTSTIWHPAPSPWGIPFRALYARDIENLLFAGRNVSVTHVALSSIRVMATCALMGQAIGTAAAQMTKDGTTPDTVDIKALQQTLMDDDCYLPGFKREQKAPTRVAKLSHEVLRDGIDRGDEHGVVLELGESVEYTFDEPMRVDGARFIFDSDLNREGWHMPKNFLLNETKYKPSKTMTRDFELRLTLDDGSEEVIEIKNNRTRLCRVPIGKAVTRVKFTPKKSFGERVRVFSFELY